MMAIFCMAVLLVVEGSPHSGRFLPLAKSEAPLVNVAAACVWWSKLVKHGERILVGPGPRAGQAVISGMTALRPFRPSDQTTSTMDFQHPGAAVLLTCPPPAVPV